MRAALLLLILSGCAAVPEGGMTIDLTPEQAQMCRKERGCIVATRNALDEIARQAAALSCGRGI